MSGLTELQAGVRRAVVDGDASAITMLLRGGSDPRQRLAIHHRHYTTSLVTALVERFPATVWLIGAPLVENAARTFVKAHPPTKPCIAEYGDDFPVFLAMWPDAKHVPFVGQFAGLEWHLGRLALAIEVAPVPELSAIESTRLPDARLVLQPGVHYLRLDWGLDGLIALYLTDSEPDSYALDANETWLELRGARGELRMNRLTHATFVFRTAVFGGDSLSDAAMAALDVDPVFDAGRALVTLLSEGLVTGLSDTNRSPLSATSSV